MLRRIDIRVVKESSNLNEKTINRWTKRNFYKPRVTDNGIVIRKFYQRRITRATCNLQTILKRDRLRNDQLTNAVKRKKRFV